MTTEHRLVQGEAYVKTTPATLPTVALPTDRIPADVSVMPVGSLAPALLTPKAPPRVTPVGSVLARLKVEPPPTANDGGLTFHAVGPAAGGAEDAEAPCSLTSHPRSRSAPEANPKRKAVRRPTCLINPLPLRAFIRTSLTAMGKLSPAFPTTH